MLTREDPIWLEVWELAHVVARQVHRKFRKFVDFDDVVQTANEYAWKRKEKVEQYLVRDDEAERRRGERALSLMLKRACERHARKEKARALGYESSDEYFYKEELVERLIAVHYSNDHSLMGQVLDLGEFGVKRKKLASEGNNLAALLADIGEALGSLEERDKRFLLAKYGEGKTLNEIAQWEELSKTRVEQICNRALRQVIDYLGGDSPY